LLHFRSVILDLCFCLTERPCVAALALHLKPYKTLVRLHTHLLPQPHYSAVTQTASNWKHSSKAMAGLQEGWVSLHTPPEELLLANTLVTGQSFRWRRTDDSSSCYEMYTGVIGQRLVQMRQLPADVQYRVLARRCAQYHTPSQSFKVPALPQ
jgi:hypothetical protein